MIKVIGEILVDVFDDGATRDVFPGGAPFNVAANIKHFGGDACFYGSVGRDSDGKFLKKFAKKQAFNNLLLPVTSKRSTTQALVTLRDGERSFRFVRDNGADWNLSLKNLEKLEISQDDIVHVGSLMLSFPKGKRFFFKAIKFAKEKGAKISFDVNYRDDIFESAKAAKKLFKKAIKEADYIKFSDEELEILTGKKRPVTALEKLLTPNQTAFVSLGKKGSFIYRNGIIASKETIEVKPVDTTGAGDAFYSYILYKLSSHDFTNSKDEMEKVLREANAVGAFATLKKGAIGVVPTIDELNSYLEGKGE